MNSLFIILVVVFGVKNEIVEEGVIDLESSVKSYELTIPWSNVLYLVEKSGASSKKSSLYIWDEEASNSSLCGKIYWMFSTSMGGYKRGKSCTLIWEVLHFLFRATGFTSKTFGRLGSIVSSSLNCQGMLLCEKSTWSM
jgi:hypothetical protein